MSENVENHVARLGVVGLRNVPRTAKGFESLNKLLQAGYIVLDKPEVGRDRLTLLMVAKEAKVSIGAIYNFFGDRVELLHYIRPEFRDSDK